MTQRQKPIWPPRWTRNEAVEPIGHFCRTSTTLVCFISRTILPLISTSRSPSISPRHRGRSSSCFTRCPCTLSAIVNPKPIGPRTMSTISRFGECCWKTAEEVSLFALSSPLTCVPWPAGRSLEEGEFQPTGCGGTLFVGVRPAGAVTATVVITSLFGSSGSNGRGYPRQTSIFTVSPTGIDWNKLMTSRCEKPRTHSSSTQTSTSPTKKIYCILMGSVSYLALCMSLCACIYLVRITALVWRDLKELWHCKRQHLGLALTLWSWRMQIPHVKPRSGQGNHLCTHKLQLLISSHRIMPLEFKCQYK